MSGNTWPEDGPTPQPVHPEVSYEDLIKPEFTAQAEEIKANGKQWKAQPKPLPDVSWVTTEKIKEENHIPGTVSIFNLIGQGIGWLIVCCIITGLFWLAASFIKWTVEVIFR